MIPYPPDPDPIVPDPLETREQYGLRILRAIVGADYPDARICRLTDDQLALALHIAPVAAAVRVTIGADRARIVDYRTITADAVADAKRRILQWQAIRARAQPAPATVPVQGSDPPVQTDGGRPARLQAPAPKYPPAGSAIGLAELQF